MSGMPTPPVQPDLNNAIQYALLVKVAEAVAPSATVYKPGDTINVAYATINLDYTVVTTFYANDLATDLSPLRANQIVSFGFVAQDAAGNVVVAIRGTDGILEWAQDGKFLAVPCPCLPGSGFTEDGFTAVYESLRIAQEPSSMRLVDALPGLTYPTAVTSMTIQSPRRSMLSVCSCRTGDSAWHSEERKALKSCSPISHWAPACIAATSSRRCTTSARPCASAERVTRLSTR